MIPCIDNVKVECLPGNIREYQASKISRVAAHHQPHVGRVVGMWRRLVGRPLRQRSQHEGLMEIYESKTDYMRQRHVPSIIPKLKANNSTEQKKHLMSVKTELNLF